jgi:hypothetical protein
MWEWINNLTWRDWLAIIAFTFACISVTNAFLSLKSRFNDRWIKKSKEALRKHLLDLEKTAQDTQAYLNQPSRLLADVLWKASSIALISCVILTIDLYVIVGLFIYKADIQTIGIFLFAAVAHVLSESIRLLQQIRQMIKYFYYPSLITEDAEKYIEAGKRLGLISDSEIQTVLTMIETQKLKNTTTPLIVDNSVNLNKT